MVIVFVVDNYGNVQQITPLVPKCRIVTEEESPNCVGYRQDCGMNSIFFFEGGGDTTTGAQVNPVINFVMLECLNQ